RLGRAVLEPDFGHVGPDAGEVSRAEFRTRIGRGTAPIKARLMDQRAIAGVGNLLADEILYQAGIDPRRPCDELGEQDLDELRRATRAAIRTAIRRGGAHTGEINPERRPGGRCPRCSAPLERARIGGRTTFWCPRHQR
ncbi:MAG: formamidopyrimidine-DNA glycosylase, partial [Actinomycetota bacterium]|nr:formamidopyrimidine-DNA glycosylase [Actinomycetota bacterium]